MLISDTYKIANRKLEYLAFYFPQGTENFE